jgi:hypothetical protein
MRRSSTTESPPTVRRRLQGEKLLHNSTEANSPSRPSNHQNDPHGVEVEPGGTADIHGEGEDCTNHKQEDAEANPHPCASSKTAILRSGC